MNTITNPIDVEEMLANSSFEIEAMKTASGFSKINFENLCQPLLHKFGAAVQRLPLSDSAFKEIDGAWKYGLTTATVALQYANSQMFFPDAIAEDRRLLEPQCHFAAFACTLATAVTMVTQNIQLLNKQEDDEYHPLATPVSLQTWLLDNPEVKLKWRRPKTTLSGMVSAAIAARFFPPGMLQPFDLKISLMIFGAINPTVSPNGIESTLARVVRMPSQKVLEHYQQYAAQEYQASDNSGQFTTSSASSIGKNLVDTVRVNKSPALSVEEILAQEQPLGESINAPNPAAVSSESLLENAKPELKEWFAAMVSHEKYSILKNQFKLTQEGIEIPATLLGMFGVSATTVRAWLDEGGLLEGRTSSGRGFVLKSGLADILKVGS